MISDRISRRWGIICTLCLLCTGCFSDHSSSPTPPLRIFAAASLSTVLPEVAEAFQALHPTVEFEFNFAASSMLAKQLEHGAAADLYLSANTQWIRYLQEQGFVDRAQELLTNTLVLIQSANRQGSRLQLSDLTGKAVQKIALADWSHVPAGIYAKQALEKAGLWQSVASKCLPALDVRAALTYVASGDADCGLVYRTDAAISKRVRIASELPADLQPRIRYTMELPNTAQHRLSTVFFAFLTGDAAGQIFVRHGFGLIERE